MKRIRFILLMSSLLLFSCFGNEFEREQIIGNYYLTTTDSYNKDIYIDFRLGNGNFVGVIPATVFSVGYDKKCIFTKQHPFDYPQKVDSTKTNYYIVPIYNSILSPEKGVLGPLTLGEFELKKVELGISNIRFNRNIK
jgi:hypothetical protein